MPTTEAINLWILANVLDSKAWIDSVQKDLAVVQASRNLIRWYPTVDLTEETIGYQAIWELQGLDPALKYQKQGVKYVSDNGERIDYLPRDKVAPDVRDILGAPFYELEEEEESPIQYGGALL